MTDRYGRHAGDAQPVAWVAADTLNSPHPGCVSSLAYMSQIDKDLGREYVPLYAAPVAAQAPQESDEPLPAPGIHAAVHYAGWLRREAHRHQEPKASVLRQTARMLDVLQAECARLHQELIDAQALQQDADPCPQCIPGGVCKTPKCGRLLAAQAPAAAGDALLDALRQIAAWPDGGNRYGQANIKRFAQDVIDAAMQRTSGGDHG